MASCGLTSQRQAKAASASIPIPGLVQAHKSIENALTISGRNASAIVVNREPGTVDVTPDADGNLGGRVPIRIR